LRALKPAARTAHSHEVHGLFRAAANGTDSRLFLWFTCAAALAGLLAIPRLVRPCRSPGWTSRFRASSPSVRSYCYARSAPALVSFAPLQSSGFQCPDRWLPINSLGIRPGCAPHRRHRCRSGSREPDLLAPPSTSSPASTPTTTLLPPLRSRGANLAIPFRPHRFSRSRRLSPPIALLAQSFAPLAQDSRACCIPLPILGFATFLVVIRVDPAPHPGHCWSVCSGSREFRVLVARFIPLKGFPPPAAVSCRHDRCLLGVRFPRSLDRFVASVAGFDARVATA
jgi:hypothetical protein